MLELNKIYNMDCLDGLKLLADKSIDLIITSPPYNVDIQYDSSKDNLTYENYLGWMNDVLNDCYRVLKTGGRLCINVPMESNKYGKRYLGNDINNILEQIGYLRNSIAIWDKQNLNSRTAWGSWMSPSCPNIINPLELIIIASKETREKEGEKCNIDITSKEFIKYSLGVWKFATEKASQIGHPAPFPIELPYRCIKMFSYRWDTILDPFMGSGTTALACMETKRKYIGFEISKEYCDIANKRIEDVKAQIRMDL